MGFYLVLFLSGLFVLGHGWWLLFTAGGDPMHQIAALLAIGVGMGSLIGTLAVWRE